MTRRVERGATPQALCEIPAFIAAAHPHPGRIEERASHRETLYRHHRRQLARRTFPLT
jgi:hypothetical protein